MFDYHYFILASSNKMEIKAVILSGGPSSVYEEGSPHVHSTVWDRIKTDKLPVLGICYGMQELAHCFKGEVQPSTEREFGRALIDKNESFDGSNAQKVKEIADRLFEGVNHSQMWMSHGDKVTKLPENFHSLAHTDNSQHAVIGNPDSLMFGLQFHPEVTHSVHGKEILKNFAVGICKCPTEWKMSSIAETFIKEVREKVGENGHVIGAVSGGVDSTVAAALLHRAIGSRFHAILVDNGCLRKNEVQKVVARLKDHLQINLHVVDASDRFLDLLDKVTEPEKKRKIIGGTFIDVFQEEVGKFELSDKSKI